MTAALRPPPSPPHSLARPHPRSLGRRYTALTALLRSTRSVAVVEALSAIHAAVFPLGLAELVLPPANGPPPPGGEVLLDGATGARHPLAQAASPSHPPYRLNGTDAPEHWPGDLRLVTLYYADNSHRLIFWSNRWSAPATMIAEAYRQRRQIEMFFRWLKDGVRIQTFYGKSDNVVRLQL